MTCADSDERPVVLPGHHGTHTDDMSIGEATRLLSLLIGFGSIRELCFVAASKTLADRIPALLGT